MPSQQLRRQALAAVAFALGLWMMPTPAPAVQAGQRYTTTVYEGQIKSVKIVKCGLQPGLCEGSIILGRQGSEDAQVDVRVGTWIKRGANFLTIEDLQIGEQVRAQTF